MKALGRQVARYECVQDEDTGQRHWRGYGEGDKEPSELRAMLATAQCWPVGSVIIAYEPDGVLGGEEPHE